MTTLISRQKKKLIIQFHATLARTGMMKQKPAILESLGVESTKDLEEAELQQVIAQLTGEGDKWRKRVIAAIFAYCKAVNLNYNIEKVKAIACRASGYKHFNDIPVSRLRDIYNEFLRKRRTTVGVAEYKSEVINYLETRN